MRPHSFLFHPIIKQSTTREPVKGCALLRFATAFGDGTPLSCWTEIDRDEGMIFFASGEGSNKGIDRKKGRHLPDRAKKPGRRRDGGKERCFPREEDV
jgi:hypothetical protein